MPVDVVVVGQIARDLVLPVAEAPAASTSATVRERREVLGGKGANQAVGLAQLGVDVAVVGTVGDDEPGRTITEQARRDGIGTGHVTTRQGTETALIVDVVDDHGQWRYLEHIPDGTLVTPDDVAAAGDMIEAAGSVVVQLQQPAPSALAAARVARASGTRVVLDGAPENDTDALIAAADVLRADAREGEQLTGRSLGSVAEARRAAADLLARGTIARGAGRGRAGEPVQRRHRAHVPAARRGDRRRHDRGRGRAHRRSHRDPHSRRLRAAGRAARRRRGRGHGRPRGWEAGPARPARIVRRAVSPTGTAHARLGP